MHTRILDKNRLNPGHFRYRPYTVRKLNPIAQTAQSTAVTIQAKAAVPVTGDRFEEEADTVADRVVQSVELEQEVTTKDGEETPRSDTSSVATQVQTKNEEGVAKPTVAFPSLDIDGLKSGGFRLSGWVRNIAEPVIGHDLSTVWIHTDLIAGLLAEQLGARAFTAGSHIAFAAGEFSVATKEGLRLLAHELTHVVQQGAAGPRLAHVNGRSISSVSTGGERVYQRAEAKDAEDSGGFIDWIISKIGSALEAVPGWNMSTWLLGYNPLTRKPIAQDADTLVKGFIGLAPGGSKLYDKLVESGLAAKALSWLEENLNKHGLTSKRVIEAFASAKEEIGLFDIGNADEVFKKHIAPLLDDAVAFASDLVRAVISFIKETLYLPLIDLIKERTRAYPLLTLILGKDPVTGEKVKRTTLAVLEGLFKLTESGEAYLAKLKESGELDQMLKWLDERVAELDLDPDAIRSLIAEVWNTLNAESVLHPLDTLERVWKIVSEPVGRIARFAVAVGEKAFSLIKRWAISALKTMAQEFSGYPLLTVVLGKDPITQEAVPRTADNFIKGFMALVPGGVDKYEDLKKAGTVDKTLEWLNGAVARLGLSWKDIVELFRQAWSSLTIDDLIKPEAALKRIIDLFAAPVSRIIDFAAEVGLKVVEFIFAGVMGTAGERVLSIINRSKETFQTILNDPIAFARNLMTALGSGFEKFSTNILTHLKAGIFGWLFSALEGAGIELPEQWDAKGIISVVLQVLGISYAKIRAKLVTHLGEPLVSKLEATFEFLRRLVTEGPGFLWEKIQESISNLPDMIIEGIKGWVVTRIVTAAITKIASMLNPVGAIIQAVLGIYNTIMFFVERIQQILDLVEAVVNSIANIAQGKLQDAANYVEATMAKTIPVIISFLARLIGLGNISEAIKNVIEKLQAKVDIVIDKVIGFIVEKGRQLLGKVGKPDKPATKQTSEEKRASAKQAMEDYIQSGIHTGKEIREQLQRVKETHGLVDAQVESTNEGIRLAYYASSPVFTYLLGGEEKTFKEKKVAASKTPGFSSVSATESLPTPYGIIKSVYGDEQVDKESFGCKKETVDRPKSVTAILAGPSPTTDRRSDEVHAEVGKLGHDEEKILTGENNVTYRGGHLIGYAMLGENSNKSFNLAPQTEGLNSPAYYQVFEKPAAKSEGEREIKVALKYKSESYEVSQENLKKHKFLTSIDMSKKASIRIARRIPRIWEAVVRTLDGSFLYESSVAKTSTLAKERRVTSKSDDFNTMKVGGKSKGKKDKWNVFKLLIVKGGTVKDDGKIEVGGKKSLAIKAEQRDF
ncbi:MAG: DUF4157 domain-containing protein [Deltaproteobacteria bacterium]|nr:DUF4157 domain-containing protein [Deltaproteobacteria bacterium]